MKTLYDWALLALAATLLCLFLPLFREAPEDEEETDV